jgi:hypothetical protein
MSRVVSQWLAAWRPVGSSPPAGSLSTLLRRAFMRSITVDGKRSFGASVFWAFLLERLLRRIFVLFILVLSATSPFGAMKYRALT